MRRLASILTRRSLHIGAALFAVALLLRGIGLAWGLPSREHWYSYHPDEYQIAQAIYQLDFLNGEFNPKFFNYPSLFIYLAYIAHGLLGFFGLTTPPSSDPVQTALYLQGLIFSGRVVSAVLGAATVPLVFFIARQIGGEKIGLLAALLMTLSPGHVQHSHFATSDVPATFFITLVAWLSLRALRGNAPAAWRGKHLMLAAFASGLAAATKYNAGLIVIIPLLTWLYLRRQDGAARANPVTIIALSMTGFLVGCPFSVLDFPTFWGDGQNMGFAYELLVHPKQGHGDVFQGTGNGWWYHATYNLPFLVTAPLALAALVGIVRTRIARRRETCLMFTWLALYFFAIGFSQVRFMRYLLPIAPTLCIFAVCAVTMLRIKPAKMMAAGALLLVSLWGTRDVLYQLTAIDPRDEAAAYMAQNTQPPATVGMLNMPWFWSPPLSPQDVPPPGGITPEQLFEFSGNRYKFVTTGMNAAKLQSDKPQWFVLSEFEWRERARLQDPDYQKFGETLEKDYVLEKSFQNIAPGAMPGRDFVPHDFLYPNPEIRIYKRR